MNKEKKSWGLTQQILKYNNVSIHRIEIFKDNFCSKHYHDHKYNLFYIENGSIKIEEWNNNLDQVKETILLTGDQYIVPPKNYHRFIALEDSVVYEIYYTELRDDDIIRMTH